ncbi:transcriptional regulator, AraC family [Fibrella aestuarina BUZ 2]|uniref:Transcriptional regulator, AraC family n=1 Tax=Fibrella aestuarina BUZ 2 TaxID=1166018 RepID=I0KDN4_9BACT|nr:AraC family transcriptional regulator [Fibrella aestuarina]CCH02237.1 transcriptional regulator, AraC family [Fibrella aestuarina BUZ 2]
MTALPLRFDVFALVMLLGIVQAGLLGFFFLTGSRRQHPANRYLGWLMLGLVLLTGDVLLGYTNYMFRVLALNDSTEPINLLLSPLFYGYVVSRLTNRPLANVGWHTLPAVAWALYSLTWLTQPEAYQYNAYLGSFHPELPRIKANYNALVDYDWLRDWINELTVLSLLVYSLLSLRAVRRAFRAKGVGFWATAPDPLSSLRFLVILLLLFPFLIICTKRLFPDDLGDYLLACYLTVIIYCTTFWALVSPSTRPEAVTVPAELPVPPDEPPVRRKYEKSALSAEQETALLSRLEQLTTTERTHLLADVSLSALARRLNTSPHHLSQVLNNRLGVSFFDWLAQHRVAEAQRLLADPATSRLKIDEIAERVGYNSPSAFHTAFKRLTNQTPAQFREALPGAETSSDR